MNLNEGKTEDTAEGGCATRASAAVIIAGRSFHGVTQELPAAQDHYLIGHLRICGALEYIDQGLRESGAKLDLEAATEGLLTRILISGRASYVLAACLTEIGQKWTVEAANRNAESFAAITDTESKNAMNGALLGLVLGFFRFATASVASSRKFSNLN